jgi:Ca2+/Na+ antiporter
LLATGSGAIIVNFNVSSVLLIFDIPILFLALSLAIYFLWSEKTLKRWEGGLLIAFYSVYAILKISIFQS